MLTLPEHVAFSRPFGDIPGVSYQRARHFTPGPRYSIRWIVIHTAECAESKNAAEALQTWCAGPNAPRASWHYAVDADSVTQSVLERDVAWHAPGANRYGIGIEHAGRARQQASDWSDEYSQTMLRRSAMLVRIICTRWDIPVVRIGADELKQGARGICGHADVSRAFGKSTHWDPGPAFPWEQYVALMLGYSDTQPSPPPESHT